MIDLTLGWTRELEDHVTGWPWVASALVSPELSRRLVVDRLVHAVASGARCAPPSLTFGRSGVVAQVLVQNGGASEAVHETTLVAVLLAVWRCCLLEDRDPPADLDALVVEALEVGQVTLESFRCADVRQLYGRRRSPPESLLAAEATWLLQEAR